MAIINTEQLRIDKYLTNLSIQQPQGNFIYDKMQAIVPVTKRSDKIYVRSNDSKRLQDDLRTGKAQSNNFDGSLGTPISYYCDDHELHTVIEQADIDEAEKPIMLEEEATEDLTSVVNLNLEKKLASILTDNTIMTNTSAITNEWDDYTNGTPVVDIDKARIYLWKNYSVTPNIMIINKETAIRLAHHPDVKDYIKYTMNGYKSLSDDVALPSILFGMNLLVAGVNYNNANLGVAESLEQVWGDNAILLHQEAPRPRTYSCIKVFEKQKLQVKKMKTFGDPAGTYIHVGRKYDVKLTAVNAGYLLTNTLT